MFWYDANVGYTRKSTRESLWNLWENVKNNFILLHSVWASHSTWKISHLILLMCTIFQFKE